MEELILDERRYYVKRLDHALRDLNRLITSALAEGNLETVRGIDGQCGEVIKLTHMVAALQTVIDLSRPA